MTADIRIREARPDDAAGIVETIRDGFDPSILRTLLYGCEGIGRYVRAQVSLREGGSDTVYTVACSGERVVGCAELRLFPGELFLNYIGVIPQFRAHRLGTALLESAIAAHRRHGQSRMSLDVLEQNAVAQSWYRKLGFLREYETEWWDVPLPANTGDFPFLVRDYPQAEVCQEAFGFSRFTVVTASGSHEIGRLGNAWFRIVRADALCDEALGSALRRLDPSRRILAVLKADEAFIPSSPAARRVAVSRRLTVELDDLVGRLRQRP